MPVAIKITLLWHLTSHTLVAIYRNLGRTHCLQAYTLLWMAYYFEKGGNIFLQKRWKTAVRLHRITSKRKEIFNAHEISKEHNVRKTCNTIPKKDLEESNKRKKNAGKLSEIMKVLLLSKCLYSKSVMIVCKLAYLQDTLKIAVNVTRLKEIVKWNKDCMNGVNKYMYLITPSKHHWHFIQQCTQIFRT